MGVYSQFKGSETLNKEGVWLEYDGVRVKVLPANENNKKYQRMHEIMSRPHRRRISQGLFTNEEYTKFAIELFAKSVIVDWETEIDGKMKRGIEDGNGGIMPFSVKNVTAILTELPGLFNDIHLSATSHALFKDFDEEIEDDLKN